MRLSVALPLRVQLQAVKLLSYSGARLGSAVPRMPYHSCDQPAPFALVSSGGTRDTENEHICYSGSCHASDKQFESNKGSWSLSQPNPPALPDTIPMLSLFPAHSTQSTPRKQWGMSSDKPRVGADSNAASSNPSFLYHQSS